MAINTIFTQNQKVFLSDALISIIADTTKANVYLGIGHIKDWPGTDIQEPEQSTDYYFDAFKNLVAIKRLSAANMSVVVRRKDWQSGNVYDAYSNTIDLFSTTSITQANGIMNVSSRTVTGNGGTTFNSDFQAGDIIRFTSNGANDIPQDREVVEVVNANVLYVNTSFSSTFTNNVAFKVQDTYPYSTYNFYIRNSKDQVFKCLSSNNGAQSTSEPEITIGGQLPESTYIETADGYKWKYLYSIDSTAKKKFLTSDWMPVKRNLLVANYATDGSIDIVNIANTGRWYNGNVASANALILTVSGDGTGANMSAKVNSTGAIYDVNILNGGSGYSTAYITASTTNGGENANLIPVIGPKNGHGYDPISELGAGDLLISVDLESDEGGTIPTDTTTGNFDYHQIILILDPLDSNGNYANGTNYSTTTQILTQGTASTFVIDEIVYQGTSLGSATFRADVVKWDPATNILYVNNTIGTFKDVTLIRGNTSGASSVATEKTDPQIRKNTGKILYINNSQGITRAAGQTEQIKLALSFK